MLLIDFCESLARKAAGVEEVSFELRVAIKHLVKNIKAESTVSKEIKLSGVKLPMKSVFPHWMKLSKVEDLLGTMSPFFARQD